MRMMLNEWARLYLKHQDLLSRSIIEISEIESGLLVKKKSGDEQWFVADDFPEQADLSVYSGVVCLNTKKNLKAVIAAWPSLSGLSMKIVFANSQTNERWVLVPQHHARIADTKNLKAGLESLQKGVTLAA